MKKQVLFFAACYYTGLLKLTIWWRRRFGRRLIILNYHRATGGDLRRHLLYLRRHYRILHLEEALEELYATSKQKVQQRDRRTPVVLTFDDGLRDMYTQAFPILSELQVPITVFIIPGYIESGNCFWWLIGDHFIKHAQVDKVTIDGHTYHLTRQEERKALVQTISMHARHAGTVAEREAILDMVREALDVPSTTLSDDEAVLNWAEIREMEGSGWVSFGGHTMHHPVLAYLKDPQEIHLEVSKCRATMEQQLGHRVRTFAYPIGKAEHIGEVAVEAVRLAGYDWAVTTIYGVDTPKSNPLQLRRIEVDVSRHWLLLAADTAGTRRFLVPLFSQASQFLSDSRTFVNLRFRFPLLKRLQLRGKA